MNWDKRASGLDVFFFLRWNSIYWNERVSHILTSQWNARIFKPPFPVLNPICTVYRRFLFEPPFLTNVCGLWHRKEFCTFERYCSVHFDSFHFISAWFSLRPVPSPPFLCPEATIYSSLLLKLRQWQRRRRHTSANCMACELTLLSEWKKTQKITKRMLL